MIRFALVRPDGRKRRQIEAVPTDVAVWQDAAIPGWLLSQLDGTRVDLDHLFEPPIPAQPPPLVASASGGRQRDMSAIMSGRQLTAEAAPLQAHICYQRQGRETCGIDGRNGPAAAVDSNRRSTSHRMIPGLQEPTRIPWRSRSPGAT